MTRKMSTHAAAAAAIRKEIKAIGVKASVRSDSYSMGSSINIKLKGEISEEDRKTLIALSRKYSSSRYNPLEDIHLPTNSRDDIPQVDHVFIVEAAGYILPN